MTSKETLYIEDALGHAKFLNSQCLDAAARVEDKALQSELRKLADKNQQTFSMLYSLI